MSEPEIDPTPEEIESRCAEIQKGWSQSTKEKRLGVKKEAKTPPDKFYVREEDLLANLPGKALPE